MDTPTGIHSKSSIWRDFVVFTAVALFCVFSARAVVKSRSEATAPAPTQQAAMPNRQLASVSTPTVEEKSTKIVDIGCLGSNTNRPPVTTKAGLARVMINECSPVKNVTAKNETTGENLLVFHQNKRISTHYFPLKPGKNRITIQWIGPKGQPSTEALELDRLENES